MNYYLTVLGDIMLSAAKDRSYYGDRPYSYFSWSIVRVYPDEVKDEGEKGKGKNKYSFCSQNPDDMVISCTGARVKRFLMSGKMNTLAGLCNQGLLDDKSP